MDPKQAPPSDKDPNDENDLTLSRVLRNVLIWVSVIISVIIIFVLIDTPKNQEWPVTFNEYQGLVRSGNINFAKVTKTQLNDFEFHGELREPITLERDGRMVNEVKAIRTKLGVVDSDTERFWQENSVSWSYESGESPWWVTIIGFLPWLLLLVAFFFITRRMQMGGGQTKGIFSFGKSKAKMLGEGKVNVTFKDVAGADEAKEELHEIIDFLSDPGRFTALGGKIPKGILLTGSPGTGKTLLARAVAGEASVPFFTISGAEFVEMFVGVGASRVRDLFEQAKKHAPCIVFIDELDAVGRHRGAGLGGGHDEREQTLNQLLVEMDGFEQNSGVIIIAATNRPDVLDPALLRPGRFDRQVVVDKPDLNGRIGILKVHTRKVPLAADVDLEIIAKGTPGMSGADLANLVNESALLAARRAAKEVSMFDFENAKDKVIMGVERKSMVMSEAEKETTAYHEIGHALASKLISSTDKVHKVTIIPRGRALGVTSYLPDEEMHTMSRKQLEARLVTLLAGRAAEQVVFEQQNTGASNDLQRASEIARKMVCEFGMSDIIGPVHYASPHDEVFLGRELTQPRDHSEETARSIDSEVRRMIMEAEHKAQEIMRENLDLLHKLSKALIEREILDGAELDIIINGGELTPVVQDVEKLREQIKATAKPAKDGEDPEPGAEGLALNPS